MQPLVREEIVQRRHGRDQRQRAARDGLVKAEMTAERGDGGAIAAGVAQALDVAEVDLGLRLARAGEIVADQLLHIGMHDGQLELAAKPVDGGGKALVVDERRRHADTADQADVHDTAPVSRGLPFCRITPG